MDQLGDRGGISATGLARIRHRLPNKEPSLFNSVCQIFHGSSEVGEVGLVVTCQVHSDLVVEVISPQTVQSIILMIQAVSKFDK